MNKDLFSEHSQRYQQARPQYSTEILDAIWAYVPERLGTVGQVQDNLPSYLRLISRRYSQQT